jgi:hypothetical protein
VDFEHYKTYLADHREELVVLSSLCWMPISRCYRDHDLFHLLETDVLPPLAQILSETGEKQMRCWSTGCDNEAISADGLAAKLGTIRYEIVTGISHRVPRIAVATDTE